MHRLAYMFGLVTAVACTTDSGDEGFHIKHNLAIGDECVVTPGGTFISRGEIFIGSPEPYVLTPEIESRLTAVEGQEALRTIALRGARVSLEVAAVTVDDASVTPPVLTNAQFTSLFAAALEPGGAVGAAIDIIPTPVLAQLRAAFPSGNVRAEVVATVTPYGRIGGGGDEVEGVPFVYPVTVCSDCIVFNVGTCPLPMGTEVITGNACNPFQDGAVECCVDATNTLICPAPVSTVPPPAAN